MAVKCQDKPSKWRQECGYCVGTRSEQCLQLLSPFVLQAVDVDAYEGAVRAGPVLCFGLKQLKVRREVHPTQEPASPHARACGQGSQPVCFMWCRLCAIRHGESAHAYGASCTAHRRLVSDCLADCNPTDQCLCLCTVSKFTAAGELHLDVAGGGSSAACSHWMLVVNTAQWAVTEAGS